jgi:purine-binding chemotaxis protein CheW
MANAKKEQIDLNDEGVQQFLTFGLGEESFGVGILHTKEIIEYGHVTQVPMMPKYIAGVINLRGSVVPVVDLALRFQMPAKKPTKRTSVIVIEVRDGDEKMDIGMVVDYVNEVVDLRKDQISPPPNFGATIRTDFIKYMGKTDDGNFMILLDVDKVLSVDELSALSALTGELSDSALELESSAADE